MNVPERRTTIPELGEAIYDWRTRRWQPVDGPMAMTDEAFGAIHPELFRMEWLAYAALCDRARPAAPRLTLAEVKAILNGTIPS